MKFPSSLVFALIASNGFATAAVVNFDFNLRDSGDPDPAPFTYTGLAAAPDAAGGSAVWNSIRRASSVGGFSSSSGLNSPPAEDSTGAASTISVTVASQVGGGLLNTGMGHGRSLGNQELGAGAYNNLMGDFLQITAGGSGPVATALGTIAGLVPNASYEFYFYGQGSSNGLVGADGTYGQNSLFSITDGLGGADLLPSEQTGWTSSNGAWTEGVEYVKFTTQANASGQVFFSWQNVVVGTNASSDSAPNGVNAGSPSATLNALQIVAVPEPASSVLGVFGVFGLLFRRRR